MSTQVIYVGYGQPFILPWMNVLEITNEFLILLCTYNLFVYSDGMLLTQSPLYPEVDEMIKD